MKTLMATSGAGEMRICAAFSCDACVFVWQNRAWQSMDTASLPGLNNIEHRKLCCKIISGIRTGDAKSDAIGLCRLQPPRHIQLNNTPFARSLNTMEQCNATTVQLQ